MLHPRSTKETIDLVGEITDNQLRPADRLQVQLPGQSLEVCFFRKCDEFKSSQTKQEPERLWKIFKKKILHFF